MSGTGLGRTPLSLMYMPPVIVVVPDTVRAPVVGFVSDAEHVALISLACRMVFCWGSTSFMSAELVTDPPGPNDPAVLTVINPELNRVATSATTVPVAALSVAG